MTYEPSDHSTSTYLARMAFLERVREVQPLVLSDLYELLGSFQQALPCLQAHHPRNLWAWNVLESEGPDANVLQLRNAIDAWGKKYGLDFDWCKQNAVFSLIGWQSRNKSFEHGWIYPGHSPTRLTDADTRFVFELKEGWRTDMEGQEAFTDRVNEAFHEYRQTYFDRIRSRLDDRGLVKSKGKNRPLVEGFDHFKLLALKIVCRQSYREITISLKSDAEPGITEDAIKLRIRRTAKLCGIDMKKVKRATRTKRAS